MLGLFLAGVDLAIGAVVAALTLRWWWGSGRGLALWRRVLVVTGAYVLYVNVFARLVPFTVSAYVLIVAATTWDAVTGGGVSPRPLQAYPTSTLLAASWLLFSAVPSLVSLILHVATRGRARERS